MKRHGFTLIEMLVTIAIVILLVSMILSGLNAARSRARTVEARNMVEQIRLAWTAYLADYHAFPFEGAGPWQSDEIMQVLRAGHADNPRGFSYFDIHQASEGVLDPWGNFYQIYFDLNGDGTVSVDGQEVRQSVAVWSMGPDGVSGTTDDIRSWR